jgi:hypothetical protein
VVDDSVLSIKAKVVAAIKRSVAQYVFKVEELGRSLFRQFRDVLILVKLAIEFAYLIEPWFFLGDS